MPLIDVRELLVFPTTPDNSTDTLIGGVHFNLTTLKYWNYTYYSNGTLSNGSWCILSFDPYTPQTLLGNGTFLNSTSCYVPYFPIGIRGKIGVAFAVFFAISIMFTFINLRKHGRLFLPATKRFRPVGRRWQWYWMLAGAGCAMISGIGSVDVDRYYLPEFPIVLTNLGYFLMLPCVMGAVWESVRHWGSWQERQIIDPNPFSLPQDDRRGRTEFYMPLVFYMFNFLNFFMTVPRSWNEIEAQRSPDQTAEVAEPNSTDNRFKAGAFMLFFAWLVICFSLRHSLHHYKPRNRGAFNSTIGVFRYTPIKLLLTIALSFVVVAYSGALAFDFSMSPLNVKGNIPFIYGLGWTPIALIFLIYEVAGYIDPNEDKELIRQRRVRGAEIDAELGFTKKPHWWSRLHGEHNLSVHEAIARNVREVNAVPPTQEELERGIEMGTLPRRVPGKTPARMPSGRRDVELGSIAARKAFERKQESLSKSLTPETVKAGTSLLFPTTSGESASPFLDPFPDMKPELGSTDRGRAGGSSITESAIGGAASERSTSTASGTTLNGPPQKIRSMLDI